MSISPSMLALVLGLTTIPRSLSDLTIGNRKWPKNIQENLRYVNSESFTQSELVRIHVATLNLEVRQTARAYSPPAPTYIHQNVSSE